MDTALKHIRRLAPETEKIKNPDRFVFQYCPISRTYTKSRIT